MKYWILCIMCNTQKTRLKTALVVLWTNRGYLSTVKWCYFLSAPGEVSGTFWQTWPLHAKKSNTYNSFYSTFFNLQTTFMYCCDAPEYISHSSKAKKLHICPFVADVTWVKCRKDLSAQRRWKALFHHERKNKKGKNVNVLNLTRNFRLCSCHFGKEKISTDSYTSGDPVCFAWNDAQIRPERHKSAKPRMNVSTIPLLKLHCAELGWCINTTSGGKANKDFKNFLSNSWNFRWMFIDFRMGS